jgi:hypothetical protein
MSETTYGLNVDEHPDVHPDILERYHGVLGDPIQRGPHQSGAGYLLDEDSNSESSGSEDTDYTTDSDNYRSDSNHSRLDFNQAVTSHVSGNVRHQAVKVPRSRSPFMNPAHETLLNDTLNDLCTSALIPAGYGVRESEWEEDDYPTTEQVRYGRRKEITLHLPLSIWLPRAVVWAQGLYVMESLRHSLYDE